MAGCWLTMEGPTSKPYWHRHLCRQLKG
jgi:hypothetical protein